LATELSAARAKAATELGARVTKLMHSLAMGDGRFEVGLTPLTEAAHHGMEAIEFLISPHRSIEPGPIDKIASGGELSRVGLAIQVVVSKVARVPTLIFDEVDSGIGGGTAEVVGRLLRELGERHQVMCVTHLPQVAACGNRHWRVSKASNRTGVTSQIEILDKAGRVEELARMLGGINITAATRQHAAELLGEY
jgi:DNA repair protein RecN (Recombination protein N)